MIIYFIRHGKTQGNILRKYIGRTDEALSELGIEEIKKNSYPSVSCVFVSPMRRCIETAKIIYPQNERIVIDELKECDFGDFEGKTYVELKDDVRYRNWISGGSLEIAGGENSDDFKQRCRNGFYKIISYCQENQIENIAVICHGGTIMSILEHAFGKSFYDWQAENGNGFCVSYDAATDQILTAERLFK